MITSIQSIDQSVRRMIANAIKDLKIDKKFCRVWLPMNSTFHTSMKFQNFENIKGLENLPIFSSLGSSIEQEYLVWKKWYQ